MTVFFKDVERIEGLRCLLGRADHLKERCISCGGKWLDLIRDKEEFERLPKELSDAVLAARQQQAA